MKPSNLVTLSLSSSDMNSLVGEALKEVLHAAYGGRIRVTSIIKNNDKYTINCQFISRAEVEAEDDVADED